MESIEIKDEKAIGFRDVIETFLKSINYEIVDYNNDTITINDTLNVDELNIILSSPIDYLSPDEKRLINFYYGIDVKKMNVSISYKGIVNGLRTCDFELDYFDNQTNQFYKIKDYLNGNCTDIFAGNTFGPYYSYRTYIDDNMLTTTYEVDRLQISKINFNTKKSFAINLNNHELSISIDDNTIYQEQVDININKEYMKGLLFYTYEHIIETYKEIDQINSNIRLLQSKLFPIINDFNELLINSKKMDYIDEIISTKLPTNDVFVKKRIK